MMDAPSPMIRRPRGSFEASPSFDAFSSYSSFASPDRPAGPNPLFGEVDDLLGAFAADERVRAVYDGIEYNATVLHQIGINSFQLRFESDEGPWDRATSRARMRKAD